MELMLRGGCGGGNLAARLEKMILGSSYTDFEQKLG
jgi:hypothetical protein